MQASRQRSPMDWSFELVAGPFGDPIEGLAWDGQVLLFSRPQANLILGYDPSTEQVREIRGFTNGTTGLAVAVSGELYGCQQPSRRIVRFNADGSTSPMPYRLPNGSYHNMPQHIIVDARGTIWFSDPVHAQRPASGPPVPFPGHQSVLRLRHLADRSWRLERMTCDTTSPSGLALSCAQDVLLVSDTGVERSELRAYPIKADGTLGRPAVLHTFSADAQGPQRGIDGLCVDDQDTIIACAGSSASGPGPLVYRFTLSGRVLETQRVPADAPTTCAFGGPGLETLYIGTTQGHLFRVRNSGRRGQANGS